MFDIKTVLSIISVIIAVALGVRTIMVDVNTESELIKNTQRDNHKEAMEAINNLVNHIETQTLIYGERKEFVDKEREMLAKEAKEMSKNLEIFKDHQITFDMSTLNTINEIKLTMVKNHPSS